MENKNERAQWSSKLGFILASAGSAVGLGNIWKFPGRAYEGGGGAFILIYLAIVILLGIPVMLTELSLGRAGQGDAVGIFKKLDKRFTWVGYIAIIIPFIITAYYSHVGGWVLRYFVSYLTEADKVYADPTGYFYGLLGFNATTEETFFPTVAIIFAAVFILLCALVIIGGVQNGIEKFNKVGMPALLALMIVLLVRSLSLEGAGEGLKYMLTADWSKVNFGTCLSALGQAFYSLSLGMGIMLTYGSYVSKKEDLSRSAITVCTMDTVVALVAGFIIVPACFATLGADQIGKGASFAFVSLAGVFQSMGAGGWIIGAVFYLLLLFAALTSCVSLLETLVSFCIDQFHWNRKVASVLMMVVLFAIGTVYTCSQAAFDIKGIWFDFKNGITFPTFADGMEFLTDRLLVPFCALATTIFVGFFYKPKAIIEEVKQSSEFRWAGIYAFLIRFIVPIAIAVILVVSIITGVTLS